MSTNTEAKDAALADAEEFLALLVRGFDRGHVKAKPVMVMDRAASQMELVSLGDKARECLATAQKARQQ